MFEAIFQISLHPAESPGSRGHLQIPQATPRTRVLKRATPNKYLLKTSVIQTTECLLKIGIGPPPLFEDIPQTMDTNPRAVYLYPNRSMNAGFNTK